MRVRSERVQQGLGTMHVNRPLPRHVILQFQNTGDRRERVTYKGSGLGTASDFSKAAQDAR